MDVTASSRERVFDFSCSWGRNKDSPWDSLLELPPAPGECYEDLEAKSEQYLLFSSGLKLGWLCPGLKVTTGGQEAEITGICKENGWHPVRAKQNVWFLLFSPCPSLPNRSSQRHYQVTDSF